MAIKARLAKVAKATRRQQVATEEIDRFIRYAARLRALHHGDELPPEHACGDYPGVSVMIERQRDA